MNINEELEKRECEVRNEGNWIDGDGEELLIDYHSFPKQPPRKGYHLKKKGANSNLLLSSPSSPPQAFQRGQNQDGGKNN